MALFCCATAAALAFRFPALQPLAGFALADAAQGHEPHELGCWRLATAVDRVKSRLQGAPANLDGILKSLSVREGDTRESLRWITASLGQELRFITIEEICCFQAANKYTMVVTAEGESLIRRPTKELVGEVDPGIFWQIHRSTLVNVNAIAGGVRDLKGHLRLQLKQRKETLPVSEPYAQLFKQM